MSLVEEFRLVAYPSASTFKATQVNRPLPAGPVPRPGGATHRISRSRCRARTRTLNLLGQNQTICQLIYPAIGPV